MSVLLYLMGHRAFRARRLVAALWAAALLLVGAAAVLFGTGVDSNVTIPGTEAQAALDRLSHTFPQVSGSDAQVVVVAPTGGSVRDPEVRAAVTDMIHALEEVDGVELVVDPYSGTVEDVINAGGTAAIVTAQLDRPATEVTDALRDELRAPVDSAGARLPAGSTVAVGGSAFAVDMPTVGAAEAVGLLIALVVLVVTFSSLLAAGMPLVTALTGVGITVAAILAVTAVAPVSSTTPLLALMLGLAVGIDYALFIVSRHVDQVRHGMDPEESAARSVATAGSAVVFAGLTVIVALVGLAVTRIPFLTVMGVAAAGGVAMAVLVALTLTPALLGFAGRRVGNRLGRRTQHGTLAGAEAARAVHDNRALGGWVRATTRWPVVTILLVLAGMLLIAVPARDLRLALSDAGANPVGSESRETFDLIAREFGPGYNGPLIVTGSVLGSTDPLGLMADLKAEIEALPGVVSVPLATPNATADTGILQVIPAGAPSSEQTADLVRELRAQRERISEEHGFDLAVTGFTAAGIDISARLSGALVPFAVFVVGLCLVLLMLVFRSLWVPLTATVGYLLSVLASFGVVAAVFGWGWGADLLNVARTGPVISFMPILVMGVLFGLAMDYQVFLVSRMREEHVHGAPAREAVRLGFLGSGKVVVAAAVIMVAVFVSFVPEGDKNIKPIALGLAVGVLVDAFLVRMTLIPAVMHLLGPRAWQIPGWLDRRLPALDVEGEAVERELALADWPGGSWALAADDLHVTPPDGDGDGDGGQGDPRRMGHRGSIRLPYGRALAVRTRDGGQARAVALALSGRTPAVGGTVRVDGLLLPGRAAAVRRRTALVVLDGPDPAREIGAGLAERPRLLVVDRLDRVVDPRQRDAVRRALDAAMVTAPDLAVVVTCTDADAVAGLLPGSLAGSLTILTLDRPALESR